MQAELIPRGNVPRLDYDILVAIIAGSSNC
jgi:hypothetical protein